MDFLGSILGTGLGIATGNPIGVASSLGGLGLSIFGGVSKTEASKRQAEISMQIAGQEMKQDAVRRQAMELSARRQQIEVLRNAQRARSLALNNATSQGAQFGSGLQGGLGQIQGATNWNIGGIRQNLGFGEQMFDLNNSISQLKIQMAQAGGQAATAQGISNLGTSLMGASEPLGRLTKGAFSGSSSGNISSLDTWGGWNANMGLRGIV